jgi:glucose/arabinose dehydrogenase
MVFRRLQVAASAASPYLPHMAILRKIAIALLVLIVIAGGALWYLSRGDTAALSVEEVTGTDPVLKEGEAQTVPTVQIAEPVGWAAGEAPTPAEGLEVGRFAEGLEHPRTLFALPNGDILVALTRAPKMENDGGGIMDSIKGWIAGILLSKAGATGESPNQIVLLRDKDGNGTAETKQVILEGLDSPSGMAWKDGTLFVANHNAVLAFPYALGADKVTGTPTKLMDLAPGGGHWMRNLELSPDGERLYVAVGSVSNIGESGMKVEEGRAMIWEYDLAAKRQRRFAAGLRNPNGLDFSPWTGELWTTVNERDMLGSDLVPDYLTNVPVGAQYGWPWVYYRTNRDRRVDAPMPRFLMEYVRKPEYALGPHVAALGLVFSKEGERMGPGFAGGAFIARHGSWNRKPPSGYDVVFVDFDDLGNPVGKPKPVLTGFLTADGKTHGRPTWVEWAADGSLLVSDDTAGIIWRVVSPRAAPAKAIAPLTGKSLPPRRLTDPRADFEADYLRQQAGQKVN